MVYPFPRLFLIRDSNIKELSKNCEQRAENIEILQNDITQARFLIVTIATQILEVVARVTFNNNS